MIITIDTVPLNVPGLGRFTLGELDWRRDLLAARLYDRENPTPLPGHTESDSLTNSLPRISTLDEVKTIAALRAAVQSVLSGKAITLSDLQSIQNYLGMTDEVYDLFNIPLQLSTTMDEMQGQIKSLKLAQMPEEMDPGVNPLEDTVYPCCRRHLYLNLKVDAILKLMEERGEQIKTHRDRLSNLNRLFDTELGNASFRLGGPGAQECMEKAMMGITLDSLNIEY